MFIYICSSVWLLLTTSLFDLMFVKVHNCQLWIHWCVAGLACHTARDGADMSEWRFFSTHTQRRDGNNRADKMADTFSTDELFKGFSHALFILWKWKREELCVCVYVVRGLGEDWRFVAETLNKEDTNSHCGLARHLPMLHKVTKD